jgi:hypothetical protein
VRGKVLEDKLGLYSVRIADYAQNSELHRIGPEKIEYIRQTKEFIATVDGCVCD